MDEIREYEKLEGSALNKVKELLAYEVTKLVHGEEEAKKAQQTAAAIFSGMGDGVGVGDNVGVGVGVSVAVGAGVAVSVGVAVTV